MKGQSRLAKLDSPTTMLIKLTLKAFVMVYLAVFMENINLDLI